MDLYKYLNRMYFRNNDTGLNLFFDVEPKLIQVKKEYYPTYRKEALEAERKWKKEEKERKEKELKEYEYFKKKYYSLYNADMTNKFQEGYNYGIMTNLSNSSGGNTSYNSKEMKLLKEAFKLLAMKHHPDRGGDNETMAEINNLKEKILK